MVILYKILNSLKESVCHEIKAQYTLNLKKSTTKYIQKTLNQTHNLYFDSSLKLILIFEIFPFDFVNMSTQKSQYCFWKYCKQFASKFDWDFTNHFVIKKIILEDLNNTPLSLKTCHTSPQLFLYAMEI